MRILAIAEDLRYPIDEGMKKTAWRIASALADRHSVLCITKFPPAEERNYILRLSLNKFFLNRILFKEIRRFSPEMVVYFPEASVTRNSFLRAWVLRRVSKAVTVVAALQPRRYGWISRGIIRWMRPDLVLASSKGSASGLSSLGLPARFLPAGVDTERFRPVNRERKALIRKNLGLPADQRIVLHVGHVKGNRNLSDLAFFGSGKGFLPVLVGSTSTTKEGKVEEDLRQKGVRVISEYMGRVEEYYQAADLYLFPVKDPTAAIDFPLSVLEAMSTGIPVLARPFGGLRDAFPPGTGIEYYTEESEIVAKAAMLLGQNPSEVTENHRNRVKRFSWDEIAQRLVSLVSNEAGKV